MGIEEFMRQNGGMGMGNVVTLRQAEAWAQNCLADLQKQLELCQGECHTVRRAYLHEKSCKAESAAREAALREQFEWLLGQVSCENLHHEPNQYHKSNKACPVLADLRAAFASPGPSLASIKAEKYADGEPICRCGHGLYRHDPEDGRCDAPCGDPLKPETRCTAFRWTRADELEGKR